MHSAYKIVSGPLMWAAFFVFIGGTLYRLWELLRLLLRKEKSLLSYMSLRYSLRSFVHWMTPFGALNMRMHPFMTVVSFSFHICLLLVPFFLLAHIVLWEEAWGLRWWNLPDPVADVMTLIVPAACIFFAARRVFRPEVRFISDAADYLFIGLVALPFLSGFYCGRQWPGYGVMMFVHMLSGQVMLAILPFTRLAHMFLVWFTRSYMGSEFGAVRHARDY
ncbi:MAG: nitrate reductase [Desulfobacteraceae bacterium]|nr:MAG: nitrate reductase [Desulfobacteraceae bacterium]